MDDDVDDAQEEQEEELDCISAESASDVASHDESVPKLAESAEVRLDKWRCAGETTQLLP